MDFAHQIENTLLPTPAAVKSLPVHQLPRVLCDNCFGEHTLSNFNYLPCALHAMLSWAVHNGTISAPDAVALVPRINPDAVWDRLGELLDDLVNGHYNYSEE